MPTIDSTIITIRVKNALAERVKATAARTGRSPNRLLNDILAATYGDADEPRR